MSNRSTAALLALVFMHAGMLGGCDDSSQGAASSGDASRDERPANSDAAVVPDSNVVSVADAGSGGGPDAGSAKQDVVGNSAGDAGNGDGKGAGVDSVPDLVARADGEKKDATPIFDSPVEADPDVRTIDATAATDVVTPVDAATRADGKAAGADARTGIDSSLSSFCQSILLENAGPPDVYPVLYREPASAAETFAGRTATLISTYGLGESDYTFEGAPISWATSIDQGMGPCTLMLGGPITKDSVTAVADGFLSRWSDLFHYEDDGRVSVSTSCFNKFCMARFEQDYCGLPVFSGDPDWYSIPQ